MKLASPQPILFATTTQPPFLLQRIQRLDGISCKIFLLLKQYHKNFYLNPRNRINVNHCLGCGLGDLGCSRVTPEHFSEVFR